MDNDKPIAHCGIDPGVTGAAALLSESGGLDVYDWTDAVQAADVFQEWVDNFDIRMVILERVSAMPKQGVTSTFNFGMNFGVWQGLLAMTRLPHQLIRPQEWQKGLFSKADGTDKQRSLTVARRLFPGVNYFKRAKDHNRADAALMARYARLTA